MSLKPADVLYLTLPVDNADQALSLSEYLSRHGLCAVPEGNDAVVCTLIRPETAVLVHRLREGWRRYWKHFDSGLFGVPVVAPSTDSIPML